MSDLEFVQRCASGDKRSWDEFVDRYSRLIYSYIHKTLQSYGQHSTDQTAQDLFQEIFLSLANDDYAKLKSYQGRNGCSLASWLRQVVIHATVDHLRGLRESVSLDENGPEAAGLTDILADKSPSAREMLALRDRWADFADCIQALTCAERFFLELHLNQGLSASGLARILRISRAAVDMRKSRIVGKLKDCFKRKGLLLDF